MVIATVIAFRVSDKAIASLAALPPTAYEGTMFLDELPGRWMLLASRVPWFVTLVVLGMFVALATVRTKSARLARSRLAALFIRWDQLEHGAHLRLVVAALSGVITWTLTLYPRNLYFDQLHAADRILLFVLWLAFLARPVAVVPFAIAATAVAGQFVVPLGFTTWTEMGVLMHGVVLFGAFFLVCIVSGRRHSAVFLFTWCCLLATTYWVSGLGKLRSEWFSYPHIALLLPAAYANGWLQGVASAPIARAVAGMDWLATPLMLGTMALECGAVLLLWKRRSLMAFLLAAFIFHVAAFAMTGIFFWKWMLVEAMLLALLLRRSPLASPDFFTRSRLVLSVVLIVAAPAWVRTENLTWFDTPLTYSLRFEGADAGGRVYDLPAGTFRPYSDALVLGTFSAMSPYVRLTGAMGVTNDRALAESLVTAPTPTRVIALEAARARPRGDSVQLQAFDSFFRAYATRVRCGQERDPQIIKVASAPRHLWTTPLRDNIPCGTTLAKISIVEVTTVFDGTAVRVIRRRTLREIFSE